MDELEKVLIGLAAATLVGDGTVAIVAAETIRRYYRMKGINILQTNLKDLCSAMMAIMDRVCAEAAERN
jgi:hypothetical protein